MRAPRAGRRVAWVSPLPPAATGIADYSAELLPALRAHCELDLVIDRRQPPVDRRLAARHLVLDADQVEARHRARPYDLFVYHVGNSHFHHYLLPLLARHRGLVVLHDFGLGGLVRGAMATGAWPADLAHELEFNGETVLADGLRRGALADWVAGELAPLNRRVLQDAGAVLVHSAWAWQRVRQATDAPAALVPHHGFDPPPLGTAAEERRRLGLPGEVFIVSTLGNIGYPKRVPSLLHALAALPPAARRDTLLLVVGDAPPPLGAELRALAESFGVAAQTRFLGHVPLDAFWSYARAADVVVQLRYPTRGESSGALLRAMAAGAACLVSDQGPMAEFPDEILPKVRSPYYEVEDLTRLLAELHADSGRREALGAAACAYVRERHALTHVAVEYAAAIETAAARLAEGEVGVNGPSVPRYRRSA